MIESGPTRFLEAGLSDEGFPMADDTSRLSRRDTLKLMVLAPASAAVAAGCTPTDAPTGGGGHAGHTVEQPTGNSIRPELPEVVDLLLPHELATIGVLADIILPADDQSGSATDAGVPDFIHFTLVDQPELQTPIRGGLAWVDATCTRRYGARFVDCTEAQRLELVDAIAYPETAAPEMGHGVEFFTLMRNLTATGFFSSQLGYQDLQYKGNIAVAEWTGAPQPVLDRLGVSYEAWDAKYAQLWAS
ncbi:MAG: gluconate 2-dehydrogenase subunit 3 family protein [Rhodothermales bacterium]